jgi:hypothetical protein
MAPPSKLRRTLLGLESGHYGQEGGGRERREEGRGGRRGEGRGGRGGRRGGREGEGRRGEKKGRRRKGEGGTHLISFSRAISYSHGSSFQTPE